MVTDLEKWGSLKMGDHVQVKLGFPEYPNHPRWKSAVVDDTAGKNFGYIIVVTYDGIEVAAGPESIR